MNILILLFVSLLESLIVVLNIFTRPRTSIHCWLGNSSINEPELSQALLDQDQINVVRTVVKIVSILPWANTCLIKTLSAKRILARYGIHSTLRIGAIGNISNLNIHAWLVVNGVTYFGNNVKFTAFQKVSNS